MKKNPFDDVIRSYERKKTVRPILLMDYKAHAFFIKFMEVDSSTRYITMASYYEVVYLRLLFAREIWEDENG